MKSTLINLNKRLEKIEKINQQEIEFQYDFSDWTIEELKQLLEWGESEANEPLPTNLRNRTIKIKSSFNRITEIRFGDLEGITVDSSNKIKRF